MSDPTIIAPSAVPKHIINAITQYGDSRADDGLASGPALGKVIAAINEHYGPALRATLPAALAPTEQAGEVGFIRAAQNIIARGFQSNGPSDATTIGSLIALFSSPACRAALAARQAPTVPKLDYDLLKLTLEQSQERLRQADEAIAKRDATALRVAQCAGEFARDAARQAPTEAPKLDQEVSTDIMGAIARGWCAPINAAKVMDSDLAIAIAREVDAVLAARQAPDSRDAAAVLPPPIGYARKQDLLTYSPAWMAYSAKPAAENGHEAVALFSEDQVRAAITQEKAQ
jgi:hypothetical protein